MMRIRLDAMLNEAGSYLYQGELFTGIGIAIGNQLSVQSLIIENGVAVAPYAPMQGADSTPLPQIEVTGVLTEDEYSEFPLGDGYEDFSGLGFEFQSGHCVHELQFEHGNVIGESWFIRDGTLTVSTLTDVDQHTYEWYPQGGLKSVTVSGPDSLYVVMSFFEDGRLRLLSLTGKFFSVLPRIIARSAYFPLRCKEDIALLIAGDDLFLGGDEIDDALIEFMFRSGALNAVKVLILDNVSAVGSATKVLQSLPQLKKVRFESRNEEQRKIADDLTSLRSELEIQFVLTPTYSKK